MKAEVEGQEVTAVQGNRCKKGIKHAEREISFPGRILTTTVRTNLREVPLLPVRSNKEIPKSQLLACMAEISKHRVDGPVKIGEPLIKDILDLQVDIVACRTVPYPHVKNWA
jgi:CxxC motif-containing protein